TALAAAAERDPGNADAWFQLGNLHREQQRFAAAVTAYASAVRLAPAHPALRNNLGLALEGAGDPQGASAEYRAALEAQPGHRQALGNLAHLRCRLRPDADAVVWTDRGICALRARDYDTAQSSLEKAHSLAPDDALILVNLGSVQVERGDCERAEEVLTRPPNSNLACSTPLRCSSIAGLNCAAGPALTRARNRSGASSRPAAKSSSIPSRRCRC